VNSARPGDHALGDHAVERRANDAVGHRLRHHLAAGFRGGDLLERRRARGDLTIVFALRDRALVEQRLGALALLFGELALRTRRCEIRLRFAGAECRRTNVELDDRIALLHPLAAFDHHVDDLAGGIGGDLRALIRDDDT
jgi:hypothetical protein